MTSPEVVLFENRTEKTVFQVFLALENMLNTTLIVHQGFHPRCFVLTKKIRYLLNRYYVIIAKCRGGLGGQVRAPPSSYQCFVFHIREKEFSRAVFFMFSLDR